MTQALRIAREKAGVSLTEMAARTHMHKSVLSRIERNQRRLRVEELPLFAQALGCTIDDLLPSVVKSRRP